MSLKRITDFLLKEEINHRDIARQESEGYKFYFSLKIFCFKFPTFVDCFQITRWFWKIVIFLGTSLKFRSQSEYKNIITF